MSPLSVSPAEKAPYPSYQSVDKDPIHLIRVGFVVVKNPPEGAPGGPFCLYSAKSRFFGGQNPPEGASRDSFCLYSTKSRFFGGQKPPEGAPKDWCCLYLQKII